MAELDTPTTPEDWLTFLTPMLNRQAEEAQFYRDYYDGKHRMGYATEKFREVFSRFFPSAATPDNWMQIVVDSSVERLGVQGFRFGDEEQETDDAAWELWQENKLDKYSRIVHLEAVKCGKAFLLVDVTQSPVRITGEHPTEVYVHQDPATHERLAALKRWRGADGHAYATLYLPELIHKFRSKGRIKGLGGRPTFENLDGFPEGGMPNPTPDGVIPMIPMENAPDMLRGGTSDLDVVIPIQDRINKLCLDLDVGSEFYAAPQRYATGWEPPLDKDGRPLPQNSVEAATSRFMAFANEETTVGSLPPGDPKSYVGPIEMYVQHIAALSHTPPHYLLGEIVNASGDALKAAETGLVSKVTAKQGDFADPWEEAICLAEKRDPADCEVKWRDPEARTFAQVVDGVVKLRQELALPLEMGWEIIGLSPEQIKRAKKLIGLPEREFQKLNDPTANQNQDQENQNENGSEREAGIPGNDPGARPESN